MKTKSQRQKTSHYVTNTTHSALLELAEPYKALNICLRPLLFQTIIKSIGTLHKTLSLIYFKKLNSRFFVV